MNMRMRDGRPGLVAVAKVAGVSAKTVSRVVNGDANVSTETRTKVEQAIAELNFRPNAAARALKSNRTYAVMLICTNSYDTYSAALVHGAAGQCRKDGYNLILERFDAGDPQMVDVVRRELAHLRPDGVILSPPLTDNLELLSLLETERIPCIRISPAVEPERATRISVDERSGARAIARHLWKLDHRHVGVIVGPEGHTASRFRLAEFRAEWLVQGGSEDQISLAYFDRVHARMRGDERAALSDKGKGWMVDIGISAARELLSVPDRPTAIFCFNDHIAAGAMIAAAELGLEVPRDLSVVGYDDSEAAILVRPALTTVNQPIVELAAAATRLVTSAQTPAEAEASLPDVELIVRASTGPAPC